MCPLQTFQTLVPPAPSPRTFPERWAVSGPPYSPCLADPPPGPQAALPPPPLTPLSQQCWGPCTSACMLGSLCTQSSTGPDASPCHSSPWGQNPGVEWTGTERTCEGKAGAPACLLAALHLAGGRWGPQCPRPGSTVLLALCGMRGKQLDSEVPQDTRRLPGGTAALSSRPAACHRHPGSRSLVASLPEASPLSETFCIPLGLLKISF